MKLVSQSSGLPGEFINPSHWCISYEWFSIKCQVISNNFAGKQRISINSTKSIVDHSLSKRHAFADERFQLLIERKIKWAVIKEPFCSLM